MVSRQCTSCPLHKDQRWWKADSPGQEHHYHGSEALDLGVQQDNISSGSDDDTYALDVYYAEKAYNTNVEVEKVPVQQKKRGKEKQHCSRGKHKSS